MSGFAILLTSLFHVEMVIFRDHTPFEEADASRFYQAILHKVYHGCPRPLVRDSGGTTVRRIYDPSYV